MTCRCYVCRRAGLMELIGKRCGPAVMKMMERIDNDLAVAETDAVYYRMKLEGTWPDRDKEIAEALDVNDPRGDPLLASALCEPR